MKATAATIRARVEDVLRIRLDGAQAWDVREYVRAQERAGAEPWAIPDGGKPLSDSQLRRYGQRADELVRESCRAHRGKLLREHIAQRRHLYARAVQAGDLRTALAVLDSLAKLLALFPSEDDALRREAEALRKQLGALKEGNRGGGNSKAAEGAGGPGERGQGGPRTGPPA
jgi:hypothetical protein